MNEFSAHFPDVICRDRVLPTSQRVLVMGIVNVTPDSFSDGGKYFSPERALAHALLLVAAGADILDLGGESSRPGSSPVAAEEELERIMPVIQELGVRLNVTISVDTTKVSVAKKALEAGVHLINSVAGPKLDPDIYALVKQYDAGLVLMHSRGEPATMQQLAVYGNVVAEVKDELHALYDRALEHGVPERNIMLDPGLGFAKFPEHNYQLLKHLAKFTELGRPLLLGPSRKQFIGKVLDAPPEGRTWGTAAAVTAAVLGGARIVRVHDVAEMRQVARVAEAILNA